MNRLETSSKLKRDSCKHFFCGKTLALGMGQFKGDPEQRNLMGPINRNRIIKIQHMEAFHLISGPIRYRN